MPPNPLDRVRTICLALPEAHEVEAWGEATFRVRNKLFAMYASAASHHGGGRPAIWVKAAPGNQSLMLQFAPHRFFSPPYVGPGGWVGVWLDSVVQWAELEELLRDAYRLTAPKRVAAQLDAPGAAEQTAPAKRSAAKQSAVKRSAAKRSTSKQSTPKRATPKRATAKRSTAKRPAKRGGKKSAARKRRG